MLFKKIENFVHNVLNKIKYKNKVKCQKNSFFDSQCTFEGRNLLASKSSLYNVKMGYASYVGSDCVVRNTVIGRYTCIGPFVKVIEGTHPTRKYVSVHPAFYSLKKQCGMTYVKKQKFEEEKYVDNDNKYIVKIGNDVWIGANCTILQGVTIGDGAIIASGSIVISDVEPYTIVGGNPAKKIRDRFNEKEIEYLNNLKWWDKPEEWIIKNAEQFEDIKNFVL